MAKLARKVAVFPGTFDPVTLGHMDVIQRGRKLFDHLIVAVGRNPDKAKLFPVEDRVAMIRSLIKPYKNVSVEAYDGLTVDLVKARGAIGILRGLRNMTDLEYEFQIALTNRVVGGIDTVFIMTGEQFGFTSSSLIKQIVAFGGEVEQLSTLLPAVVIKKLKQYQKRKVGMFGNGAADLR